MNEDDVAGQWLYSTLVADATLAALTPGGIHEGVAPPDVTTPYVVFAFVSGVDRMAVGAIRVWTDMLWDVTAVAQGTDTRVLRPISARIDALLHDASGTVASGGVVLTANREAVIRRGPERDATDGRLYLYRTQEYRVKAQKT